MNVGEVLNRFDSEMRERCPVEPGTHRETVGPIVRVVGDRCFVIYSRLEDSTAAEVAVQQTAFFRSFGKPVEWKVYGHDRPRELGKILSDLGYSAEPSETLEVLDLEAVRVPHPAGSDIEVRRITSGEGLDDAIRVSEEAFGAGEGWPRAEYAARLDDPTFAGFVAYVHGTPASAGRLEMPAQRAFASLWGGGTVTKFRGMGIYRTLVAVRAELARERGYRYLTVDARETSRPILERIGFVPLTTITGWTLQSETTPADGVGPAGK